MSVPLDAIAVCDTTERITEARELLEYRRLARLELEHILAFQRELPPTAPLPPTTPKLTAITASTDLAISPIQSLLSTTASPTTTNKTPTTTNSNPTPPKAPNKVATHIKRVLGIKKKASTDDFSDIERAMGSERLERGYPVRLRTADPVEGGQLEEDWEWYLRSVSALPRVEW